MTTFNELIDRLMSACNDSKGYSIEETVMSVAKELNLSEEEIAEIKESFEILDAVNMKAKDLENARQNGLTRNGWMKDQLTQIVDNYGENAEVFIQEINKGVQEGLEETLTQEN